MIRRTGAGTRMRVRLFGNTRSYPKAPGPSMGRKQTQIIGDPMATKSTNKGHAQAKSSSQSASKPQDRSESGAKSSSGKSNSSAERSGRPQKPVEAQRGKPQSANARAGKKHSEKQS